MDGHRHQNRTHRVASLGLGACDRAPAEYLWPGFPCLRYRSEEELPVYREEYLKGYRSKLKIKKGAVICPPSQLPKLN
jgi:hypothetical protein